MKKRTLVSLVILLFTAFAGCQHDGTGRQSPAQQDMILSSNSVLAGCPTWTATELEVLDSLEYEEFSGSIAPGQGGWLSATMQTWPKNSNFNIMVPPGALPDDATAPVAFSMRIPTRASYEKYAAEHGGEELPLIIRLEPSGILFHENIIVMGTYMPWRNDEIDPDCGAVFWSTEDGNPTNIGEALLWLQKNRWRVRFEAPHFSDWEHGTGTVVED